MDALGDEFRDELFVEVEQAEDDGVLNDHSGRIRDIEARIATMNAKLSTIEQETRYIIGPMQDVEESYEKVVNRFVQRTQDVQDDILALRGLGNDVMRRIEAQKAILENNQTKLTRAGHRGQMGNLRVAATRMLVTLRIFRTSRASEISPLTSQIASMRCHHALWVVRAERIRGSRRPSARRRLAHLLMRSCLYSLCRLKSYPHLLLYRDVMATQDASPEGVSFPAAPTRKNEGDLIRLSTPVEVDRKVEEAHPPSPAKATSLGLTSCLTSAMMQTDAQITDEMLKNAIKTHRAAGPTQAPKRKDMENPRHAGWLIDLPGYIDLLSLEICMHTRQHGLRPRSTRTVVHWLGRIALQVGLMLPPFTLILLKPGLPAPGC